jgi:hypothetical protein
MKLRTRTSIAVLVRKIRPGSRKNISWRILKLKKECVTFSEKLTKKEKHVQIITKVRTYSDDGIK